MQHLIEQLTACRERSIDARRGERRVQRNPNLDGRAAFREFPSQQAREQHQMVVVHPYQVAVGRCVGSLRDRPFFVE